MKLISFGRHPLRVGMTSDSRNWKGSISEAETSDDGEPRLQIVDPFETDNTVDGHTNRPTIQRSLSLKEPFQRSMSLKEDVRNASEAVESLLMLGRPDVWTPNDERPSNERSNERSLSESNVPKIRRFSSGDMTMTDEKGVVTYYQKMRERNNEASKRCRLKRRLKAESLEGQLNYLGSANSMLKQRITRMENISKVMKDGINQIKANDCNCLQIVALIQKVNRDYKETMDLTNAALLKTSKSYRDQNPQLLLPSSSDDEFSVDVPTTMLSITSLPTTTMIPPNTSTAPPTFSDFFVKMNNSEPKVTKIPVPINGHNTMIRQKTALDVLNDTIIKSLGSSPTQVSPFKPMTPPMVNTPLNLVKLLASPSSSTERSPLILVTPNPFKSDNPMDLVKKEPESSSDVINGVDPTETCIASALDGQCNGPLVNVNNLTSYLNTLSGKLVSSDDGTSAMERAIIKSRMRIPFWKAEEFPSFICESHRKSIIGGQEERDCVICGKKKAKKIKSPNSIMFSITYRMSLENHIKNGSILPIGHLVCGFCKDKHLKGIDTSSSQIITQDSPQGINQYNSDVGKDFQMQNTVSVRPATSSTSLKRLNGLDLSMNSEHHSLPVKIRPSPPCFSAARNTTEVQVIIQPVRKEVTQVQAVQPSMDSGSQYQTPSSSSGSMNSSNNRSMDNIFSKISRLNEALHSINPKYKPIGFSITSIESCSASILQDAVCATETAVSTLMSVIAPGQESFLWESIKPLMDQKLNGGPQATHSISNNNNNNNKS